MDVLEELQNLRLSEPGAAVFTKIKKHIWNSGAVEYKDIF